MKADKKQVTRLLKTARGQIDGVLKMVEEDRYCLDISCQVMAAEALLKKVNREIIEAHLKNCVNESLSLGTKEEAEEKINELIKIIERL